MFDLVKKRKIALDTCGYRLTLSHTFEETKAKRSLTYITWHQLNDAVLCFILGFDEPAVELLERAFDWVRIAIEEDEDRSHETPGVMRGMRFRTLAMCKWLLRNEHDEESLRQAAQYADRVRIAQRFEQDLAGVSLSLPEFADAAAYERALEIFADCTKLSPPKSLGKINNEAQMVYVLARLKLGIEGDEAAVAAGANKFLRKHMDHWLEHGHYDRAAQWLKILHWNDTDRQQPAKLVVMKCYDYLPAQRPPD
jgi:hypothetical protein